MTFYVKDKNHALVEAQFLTDLNGIPVGKLGFMAICEAREINLTPAVIEMIIYDSTGEIALENSRRSESWERAANSLHIPLVEPFPGSKVGEVTDTQRIMGHYYSLYYCSDCEYKSIIK
jgi:hypothetical protein